VAEKGEKILLRFAACQVPLIEERDLGRGNTNATSENLTPGPSPQERGEDPAKNCSMPSPYSAYPGDSSPGKER
jgi:hypothetical protein